MIKTAKQNYNLSRWYLAKIITNDVMQMIADLELNMWRGFDFGESQTFYGETFEPKAVTI